MASSSNQRRITNASNASTNVAGGSSGKLYTKVLDFLEQSPSGIIDWCPKDISDELGLNVNSVRWVVRKLLKNNKVVSIPKGKFHYYRATKRCDDDVSRLMRTFPLRPERYELHGLTLKLTSEKLGEKMFKKEITNAIPLGGMVRCGWKGIAGVGTRETRFQLSRGCLMVWCGCTNMPFDYEGFVTWLARVDGFLAAKGWPRIEGNLEHWELVQFGISKDYRMNQANKLLQSVSLKGTWEWLAEVYEKKMPGGETVLRSGLHSNDAQTLASMVGLMNGDISRVQAEDLLRTTADAQNNNTRYIQEVVKGVQKVRQDLSSGKARASSNSDDESFLLGRIEQKIDDLTSVIETFAKGQEKLVDALGKLFTQKQPENVEQPTSKAPNDFGMVV